MIVMIKHIVKEEKTFKGDACMPRMINNICEYYPRTKLCWIW